MPQCREQALLDPSVRVSGKKPFAIDHRLVYNQSAWAVGYNNPSVVGHTPSIVDCRPWATGHELWGCRACPRDDGW